MRRNGRPLPAVETFTRPDAVAAGWSDKAIRREVRESRWRRLRRGSYAMAEAYDPLDPVDRHVVEAVAAARALGPASVLSHTTAVAMHRLDLWNADLGDIHVTRRTTGAARREGGVRFHCGRLEPEDVTEVAGVPVVVVLRGVVEAATANPFETGLILTDHALNRGDFTRTELLDRLDAMDSWPGIGSARSVAAFADGRSESAGESLARWLIVRSGLPAPVLQHEIRDDRDEFVARVDLCLVEERVVLEFDGFTKYGADAATAAQAVTEEKQREDRIREQGYVVVRLTWADLFDPVRTIARIRRAMQIGVRMR